MRPILKQLKEEHVSMRAVLWTVPMCDRNSKRNNGTSLFWDFKRLVKWTNFAFNQEHGQLIDPKTQSLHIFCALSSYQSCIERGWCFNHGRRAHCDVQPPLGSLIVPGQPGSADHPASGMANDSHRSLTHAASVCLCCVCLNMVIQCVPMYVST